MKKKMINNHPAFKQKNTTAGKELTIFSFNPANNRSTPVRVVRVTPEFQGIDGETNSINPMEFKKLAESLEPYIKELRFTVVDL